ncbi:hypothetical protein [Pseudomonas phage UF_RH7]|nr:hypothetical protein [Pseudomonas phage UF_RH7]
MSKPPSPNRPLVLNFIAENPGCHGGDVRRALAGRVNGANVSNTLSNLARDGSIVKTGRNPNIRYWIKGCQPKFESKPSPEERGVELNKDFSTLFANSQTRMVRLGILTSLINTARNVTELCYKDTPEGSHERARMQEILQRMNLVDDLMKGAASCQQKSHG